MEASAEKIVNGVNVTRLSDTLNLIREKPEISRFQFRAANHWDSGMHNEAIVKDFYGALQEDTTRSPMHFDEDEPPVLLGVNKGANPVEYLLVALSGCLTTALVTHAAANDIRVKDISSRYEGDIDLRGFLGISDDVPKGYQKIKVLFKIDADIPDEQKEELVRMAQKYSPVFNMLKNTVPISVALEK